jgi:signal transduction histidine kinase
MAVNPQRGASGAPGAEPADARDRAHAAPPRSAGPKRPWRAGERPALIALVVAAALALLGVAGWAGASPAIGGTWRYEAQAVLELAAADSAAAQSFVGHHLVAVVGADGSRLPAAGLAVQTPPRWTVDDAVRRLQIDAQRELARQLGLGPVRLEFDDGRSFEAAARPRGLGGLGAMFWLFCAAALAMAAVGGRVLIRRPGERNGVYVAALLAQAATMVVVGIESMPGLGEPAGYSEWGLRLRAGLDLFIAGAVVHLATLPPLQVRRPRTVAVAAWAVVGAIFAALALDRLDFAWAWMQGIVLASGAAAVALCARSYRVEPNPFALLSQHMTLAALAPIALLTAAQVAAQRSAGEAWELTVIGPVSWTLFLSLLLVLVPFASRSRLVLRELAMLAGIGSVAVSTDLLLVALFGLERLASLGLALFIALGLYAASRRRLPDPGDGSRSLGAGRAFERLYRGVRDVESNPQRCAELMSELLRDLFEPLEVQPAADAAARTRIADGGATLIVPLAGTAGPGAGQGLRLRFAGHGRRLFGVDDARLADQVVEQLCRALLRDAAVERGRSEERARIAQDLHDDIGARLLTLMYKAQDPEMEDYVRHTLKDLKTLTRGLAASGHRLSFAAAEWKADIAQRLAAAQIELDWSLHADRDPALSVVQWSALTRVLRELVSNVIQHSAATHVDIEVSLVAGRLRLTMADDGVGRDPQHWAHGLGLGGVRKRVKLLGGDVQWAENGRAGIVCTVLIPDLANAGR